MITQALNVAVNALTYKPDQAILDVVLSSKLSVACFLTMAVIIAVAVVRARPRRPFPVFCELCTRPAIRHQTAFLVAVIVFHFVNQVDIAVAKCASALLHAGGFVGAVANVIDVGVWLLLFWACLKFGGQAVKLMDRYADTMPE